MSQDNMGAEQTTGRAPSAQDRRISTLLAIPPAPTQPETVVLPRLTPEEIIAAHKHSGSFADIRSLISPAERSQRKEEKKVKVEDQLGADVERIATLLNIDSSMAATRFDEFGLPPQVFPVPEELLISYATADEKKDEREKGELREGVRLFTEQAIKRTLARLTDDIKTLYLDRGASQAEAGSEIDALTQRVVNQKRKVIGLLGKDQQMGILETLSERRAKMLRDNMPHYMYHLSEYAEAARPRITDQQVAEMRREFAAASEDEQVKMAAEARTRALAAMDRTRKANLDRLREIEIQEGKSPKVVDKEMEDLRAIYRAGSLRQKERVIDRIKARKAVLSLPYLGEISRLRQILEREDFMIRPESDFDDLDDKSRLLAETSKIEHLLIDRICMGGLIAFTIKEVSTDDMEKEVKGLTKLHEDPGLVQAFNRVRLLRTTSTDISDL